MNNYDYIMKIAVVGNYSSGKTSLSYRYTSQHYNKEHVPTIGVDFFSITKTLVDHNSLPKTIKYQIWDTAGQERFKAITDSYIKNATAILIVFDLTSESTLLGIQYWIELLNQNKDKKRVIYLVGTKSDCLNRIDSKLIENEIKKYGLKYFETSSLTGEGVENVFDSIVIEVLELIDAKEIEPTIENGIGIKKNTINLINNINVNKKINSCC